MSLTPYNHPYDLLRDPFTTDRLFGNTLNRINRWMGLQSTDLRLDVEKKDENNFEVTAEIPGVRAENIQLQPEDNVLRIQVEKKEEREHKDDTMVHSERSYGLISRTIPFPSKIDIEKSTSTLENGLLKIHVVLTQGEGPRQINVKEV